MGYERECASSAFKGVLAFSYGNPYADGLCGGSLSVYDHTARSGRLLSAFYQKLTFDCEYLSSGRISAQLGTLSQVTIVHTFLPLRLRWDEWLL